MKLLIPAPVNVRELLLAFGMYEAEKGLPSLLSHFDYTDVTRRQIFFNTLARPPSLETASDGPRFNARAIMSQALQSDEFQTRLREIVLGAFPEKRRRVFIHIPKCAGTDLEVTLSRRYPSLHLHLSMSEITTKPMLFDHLQGFAVGVGLSDSISVCGHVPLSWYQQKNLLRFEDDVFTSVRNPRDIVYSYISFVLTRIVDNIGVPRRDVSNWLTEIGAPALDTEPSPAYLAELGSRLLRTVNRNLICYYLGARTAASAIEGMVMSDIEITDMARYSEWRRRKFSFEPARRVNPSKPLFTPEIASKEDRDLIEEITGEDMIVYEAIQDKLRAQDGLSIRGRVFG